MPKLEAPGLQIQVVQSMLRPQSVAIIGFSTREGSPGRTVLKNLEANRFGGEIYLVGRSEGEFDGRSIIGDIAALPEGVDLSVMMLPAEHVQGAIEACVEKMVGSVVIFASGFAEVGGEARDSQDALTAIAERSGIGIVGPNCLGFTNYVDQIDIGFLPSAPCEPLPQGRVKPVAVIAQSGGLMGLISQALTARRIPIAYRISTGNEAGLGLSDYIAYMATDENVGSIVVYAEHIRRPAEFLEAARRARAAGKNVVLMHTGRGAKAQHAAASHTGALAGDYKLMATQAAFAGVVVTESIEEMVDCAELTARFPEPPVAGAAVITTSGAFCAIAHDASEDIGLDLPPLSQSSLDVLTPRLPAFTPPNNPLDLTTQPAWDAALIADSMLVMMDDAAIGSVTVAVPLGQGKWLKPLVEALPRATKPVQLALFIDDAEIPAELEELARSGGLILSRSPERALRAIGRYTEHGRRMKLSFAKGAAIAGAVTALEPGTQPEWRGKQLLAALGVSIPAGDLATSPDEAVSIANRIGYPVVLKVQAAELAHKTEVGGVIINIASDETLRAAYSELAARVAKARPDVLLDGMLVEQMAGKGLELVAGATRDPQWGPVVMVGIGGIFVEALKDVRIIPAGLDQASIVAELNKLKLASLLGEFRGAPAPDVEAAAKVVETLGLLMLERSEIAEIDVNPLVALPLGQGAVALDALIVVKK